MSSTVVTPMSSTAPVEPRRLRTVAGRFTTGVVAVTALRGSDGAPAGLAVNSFTSVSLTPPLVLFCVARSSSSWPDVRSADRFCVNILGENQRELSARFATSGTDKFGGVPWQPSPGGAPVLDGSIGWLECSVEKEIPAGDHDVVLARVHDLDTRQEDAPLLFYGGLYGRYARL